MPTYEFRCAKGHEFQRFYKTMSTAALELPCPECDTTAARQLSAGAGLHFKGSGFYLTDYGKNAHRGTAPESKSDKGDGKSDAASGKADGASKADGAGKADGASKADSSSPKPATESKPAASTEGSKPKPSKPKAE
jgi:putative FmdB family regulatory protein